MRISIKLRNYSMVRFVNILQTLNYKPVWRPEAGCPRTTRARLGSTFPLEKIRRPSRLRQLVDGSINAGQYCGQRTAKPRGRACEGLKFLTQASSLSGHQEAISGLRARLVSRVRFEEVAGQLAVKAFKAKASPESHALNATAPWTDGRLSADN